MKGKETIAELRDLAESLAVEAEFYECSEGGKYFSLIAENWWQCQNEPHSAHNALMLRRSVAQLRSKLATESRRVEEEMQKQPEATITWAVYPFKSYKELYPDQPTGTFSCDPHVLELLGNPPPIPTYSPSEDELEILRSHFPQAELAAPPWKDIKARLIAAGLSLESLKQLKSGDLVRVLAEKRKPPEPVTTTPTGYSAATSPLVRSLVRCRTALESAIARHRPIAAMLVHHSDLGNRPEWLVPKGFETLGHYMLCSFHGPYQDHQQLIDDKGAPLVGDRPYTYVDGNPIVYSDGSPVAMYPGASRMIYLYGREFLNSNPGDYSDSVSALQSVAEELGSLLLDLPIEAKEIVWREWPHNYRYTASTKDGIWFDAVYELAFQNHTASGLTAERYVWGENKKLGLENLYRFRERPDAFGEMFSDLIEHAGYPPSYWYSWLGNIGSASVAAIDLLLTIIESVKNEQTTPSAELTEQSEGGNGKTDKSKKPTVNDRMKAELASNLELVQGWTAQQWATKLDCGKTTVIETETWRSISLLRQQAKAEKRADRRRK